MLSTDIVNIVGDLRAMLMMIQNIYEPPFKMLRLFNCLRHGYHEIFSRRGEIIYILNGLIHRDPAEGPALVNESLKKYCVYGKPHRDPTEGPAIVHNTSKGVEYYLEYFMNGKRHRDPTEGPAEIYLGEYCDCDFYRWYNYYVNGERHRDGAEGPAEIYISKYGLEKHVYWHHGKEHRDPDLGPAKIHYQHGMIMYYEYVVNGRPPYDIVENPFKRLYTICGDVAYERPYLVKYQRREPRNVIDFVEFINHGNTYPGIQRVYGDSISPLLLPWGGPVYNTLYYEHYGKIAYKDGQWFKK